MSISLINQMNKEWFIFKGTHHLGPFSLPEMEEFFTVGEINVQTMVWREGAEKWEALGKTRELQFLLKSKTLKPQMPDVNLPPLPTDIPELPDLPPLPPSVDDLPPPIPLDALLNPLGKRPDFTKKKENSFFNGPKFLFGILIVIFVIVMTWFLMNEKSSSIQIRVRGVMPVYVERLQEAASQKTPSIVLSMGLSLDGKTLYASTNKDGEILAIIKMKSLPKRILGTNDVELMVRGVIRDHIGEFAKMQLISGEQFVPGEYAVDFTGRKIFFLNRWFKALNGIEFFKKLNTTYTYQTHALIYAGTPREFEKKILEYTEAITNEKLKPFNDKLERLQTFSSLLNKTVENYLLALESLVKPKDISNFEKQYIKDVSPIIQSLVVAANEISKTTEGQEIDTRYKVASYSSQIQLGKQIGEMASDMITETGKMKKISDADKINLKSRFEARYKNIKSQIDAHITQLQAEILKIQ